MTFHQIQQTRSVTAVFLEKKVEEYVKQLAVETDVVRQSQEYKVYLYCMAKFWQYSLRNQLLIHMQYPNAVRVAGFRTWNDLNRMVIAGSKAIKILAPFTKKIVKKDEKTGEEKETEFTYFCPVSVFDVSQTFGKELPKLNIEIAGNSHKTLLNKLLTFCQSKNIIVEFKEIGINGLYGHSQGGKIVIACNQSVNMQVNTLVHEIAHELTHYSEEGKKFSKQERETQAESTAYVVCKTLGLTTHSSTYLVFQGATTSQIMDNLKIISSTVQNILSKIT